MPSCAYVDDGARDMDEAIKNVENGITDRGSAIIIVTPHFRRDMFETPMEQILKQFLRLREIGKKIGIQLFLAVNSMWTTEW